MDGCDNVSTNVTSTASAWLSLCLYFGYNLCLCLLKFDLMRKFS